jgi:hypothetical protein
VARLRRTRPFVRSVPTIVGRAMLVVLAVAGLRVLRYFARKLLSSSDLEQEQSYAVGERAGEVWKYTPFRRLLDFLEQSLNEGLRWAGFEPQGDPGAKYRMRSRRS